ncbi:MAG: hypothetical protein DCC75_13460 [Proteobacteria bacterium]|nr:MAG: hypothetical protein DCC75_13460 [Pseudomonadota bacterium]
MATVKVAKDAVLVETPRKQMLKVNNSVESVKRALDQVFMLRVFNTAVFPDADPVILKELVTKVGMKNFKKGDVLFKEGDEADVAYVIRKGSVKVSRRNRKGADVTQTYLPAGHLVGEMALFIGEPATRSATVVANVPCETIVINKADFLDLMAKSPEVKSRVEKLVRSRQVENITSDYDEYAGSILDFVMKEGITDAENVLLIDSDLCIACDNCERACAATHGGYSRLDRKGGKSFAAIQIPISCRHCENPLCMLDCPPDALTRLADGEVIIRDSCIGCGNCVRNCPYGVIQLIHENPHAGGFSLFSWLFSKSGQHGEGPAKAGKCDQCTDLAGGPACVRSCPTGAAMRVNPRSLLKIISEKQPGV